ncbi:MAG: serine protein kinase PrkA [Deltaproteobacteria bacterium]|nr:serine protein kinase PrkA [Deltaproteobacteria bacterium]
MSEGLGVESILSRIEKEMRTEFEKTNRILSFYEYLKLAEDSPRLHLRGSAQYLVDAMDHFGRDGNHFKLFDMTFDDPRYRVIGLEDVQNEIYRALQGFAREGVNNKLILLHGPNGSAKSCLINCLIRGIENYSQTPDGALYRFSWIFPAEKVVKGSFGLATHSGAKNAIESFARLPDDEISAKMPCELKDHPLLLLPAPFRAEFFEKALTGSKRTYLPEYLAKGALSHKSNLIFEALLTAYKGDLRKVLMHVQVERFYISKRYRSGAVTIEPQMHVDAQSRQITMDKSLSYLPPSLQSLSLHELSGDLIDANRGLVEYADILKRPVDTFKYLLTACESGAINVGAAIAPLDTVFIGSTNEVQLDAFKEFPDFVSFKARIELIRVPYLLAYSRERKIYDLIIGKIAGSRHLTPHVTFVVSLWAVLTRLKKPNPSHYVSPLSNAVAELTPLEKAKFYDHGEVPEHLNADEKNHLRSSLNKMLEEYSSVPYFEGRMGASAREIKGILYDAAANPEFKTLSPLAVLMELEEFVKRVSEYEFLKQDIKDDYHDARKMIETVRHEYLRVIDQEVRVSMGLIQAGLYEEFLKKYILHLSHLLKKETIKNPITGRMEAPDAALIDEFENTVAAPTGASEREAFRNNIISNIGAYALDNPSQPVEYSKVFPEFIRKLENHYFEQQKSQMRKIGDAIQFFGTENEDRASEGNKLARKTIRNMVEKYGYSEDCAPQTIQFLIKSKY